jgi:hypothetical protein
LEVTQPIRFSFEFSFGIGDHRSNRVTDSFSHPPQQLGRRNEVSNENLHGRVHQGDSGHTIIVPRRNLSGFRSLLGWSWKHVCLAKLMELWKRSPRNTQGCTSERCCIGHTIPGGVGHPGCSGTICVACMTQNFAPDARQDAASGDCTSSHNLPPALWEFASDHGSSMHRPCAGADYAILRGAHSEAISLHPALLVSPGMQACLEAIKFRIINIVFQDSNGKRCGVRALQDTGADPNAITYEFLTRLGYHNRFRPFTEADRSLAPLALGGNVVDPSGTIELPFWKCCDPDHPVEGQVFNVYTKHQLGGYQVILSATLTKLLAHLQRISCGEGCDP